MKKKIIVFILLLVSIFVAYKNLNTKLYISRNECLKIKEVCLISNETRDVLNNKNFNRILHCGNKILAYKNKLDFDDFSNKDVDYVEVSLFTNNLNLLLKNFSAKVLFKEIVDGKNVFYCYTNIFEKTVFLKFLKVNLQIVECCGCVKLGSPMIYSSF